MIFFDFWMVLTLDHTKRKNCRKRNRVLWQQRNFEEKIIITYNIFDSFRLIIFQCQLKTWIYDHRKTFEKGIGESDLVGVRWFSWNMILYVENIHHEKRFMEFSRLSSTRWREQQQQW